MLAKIVVVAAEVVIEATATVKKGVVAAEVVIEATATVKTGVVVAEVLIEATVTVKTVVVVAEVAAPGRSSVEQPARGPLGRRAEHNQVVREVSRPSG